MLFPLLGAAETKSLGRSNDSKLAQGEGELSAHGVPNEFWLRFCVSVVRLRLTRDHNLSLFGLFPWSFDIRHSIAPEQPLPGPTHRPSTTITKGADACQSLMTR